MPSRHGRYVAALGGLAAILLLGAAPVPPPNQPKGAAEGQPSAKADGAKGMSAYERESLVVDRTANSIAESANAISRDQRRYALWQLGLGGAGVAFTAIAALAAIAAAIYAKHAAEAARESATADNQALTETRSARRNTERTSALELRAWVTLRMEPKAVRPTGEGLYFIVDFVAENIGATTATHFDFNCEVFFKGQTEDGAALVERVGDQLERWRADYDEPARVSLLPKDTQMETFMNSRQPPTVQWWKGLTPVDVAQPVFLAAVLYRTVMDPKIVQLSWRTWYLGTTEAGMSALIPRGKRIEGNELVVSAFETAMRHEEHKADRRGQRRQNS